MFGFANRPARIFALTAIALALIIVLFPFLWIFLEAIKPPSLGARPDVWLFGPTGENWNQVLLQSDVPVNILNSFVVSVSTVVIALPLDAAG